MISNGKTDNPKKHLEAEAKSHTEEPGFASWEMTTFCICTLQKATDSQSKE